jgi:uncharacterized protein (UPF0335 family)
MNMNATVPESARRAAAAGVAAREAGLVKKDTRQTEAFTDEETGKAKVENIAAAELRSLIERIERLEEEKAAISTDIKDVYGEAKGRGYDDKAMRTIVRLRKKDANERIEEETILQTYMAALGMA